MTRVKLSIFIGVLAVCVSLAGSSAANAEDGSPAILCLTAGCVKELTASVKGGPVVTETLSGLLVESATAESTVSKCEPVAGTEEKDVSLCKDVTLVLRGVKTKGANCNTEGDEKGVIKTFIDLHLAAGLNLGQTELVPLGLGKVLNAKLEAVAVKVKCGLITVEVKGTFGCLVPPGLTNIAAGTVLEVTCKMNQTTHDIEIGKCELLCQWLEEDPFLMKLGSSFEDAAKQFTMTGSANKDVFVDD